FQHTPTTGLHTLSLPDALPISRRRLPARPHRGRRVRSRARARLTRGGGMSLRLAAEVLALKTTHPFVIARGDGDDYRVVWVRLRSEEHTSELQSRGHLVCRLLL